MATLTIRLSDKLKNDAYAELEKLGIHYALRSDSTHFSIHC